MNYKKKENPPKYQKHASAHNSNNISSNLDNKTENKTKNNTANKTTNNSRSKPSQVCDGCGYYYFLHQLHTCPSCGKQFCDDCYPKHICKKQRVVPPPNTHIALDQQEWYNKQPTPCDNCENIVRADALRKLDGKKLCPDCILKFANAEQQREKRNTILAICTVVIIIIWVLSHLRG